MKRIPLPNYRTCLNLHKIAILAALVYLGPPRGSIVEVGSYQCGTTIFLAQLCRVLEKRVKIYACDTFEGIPAATAPDRADLVHYDSGMFQDNPIESVKKRIVSQGVQDCIELIKGDVVHTLPHLKCDDVFLAFLDTDQYKGTRAGLDLVARLDPKPHVIVDDCSLSSVSLAIDEFMGKNHSYSRRNVALNFDYLIPGESKPADAAP